jgi:pyruvate/2-oxoglutarate dehydrogenase complex dihydrolipoamide dehydrogenase (E3) component
MVPVKELKKVLLTMITSHFRGEAHFINSDIAVNDQSITGTQIFINVGARAIPEKSI